MNTHVQVKAYMVEDDLGLFSLDDGKYTRQCTEFLVKQEGVVQVEVDSKKLMPLHAKDK